MKLSKPLFGKYHEVFMDRFFTSIKLVRALESNDTYATGTCQTNRKYFPEALKGLTLDVGQFKFSQEGSMVATAWHDKGQLAFLSTSSAPKEAGLTVKRRQKDGTLKDVPAPPCAVTYNKFMGGVDHADQIRKSYTVTWKSKKWWRRIFFFCLDQAICNAFILMKESPNHQRQYTGRDKTQKSRTVNHLEFHKALAKELIGNYTSRKRKTRPENEPTAGHWPKKINGVTVACAEWLGRDDK